MSISPIPNLIEENTNQNDKLHQQHAIIQEQLTQNIGIRMRYLPTY